LPSSDTGKFHGTIAPHTTDRLLDNHPVAAIIQSRHIPAANTFRQACTVLERVREPADLKTASRSGFARSS